MSKRKFSSATVDEIDFYALTHEKMVQSIEKNGCLVVKNVVDVEKQAWALASIHAVYSRVRDKNQNRALGLNLNDPTIFFDKARTPSIPPARGTGILNVDGVGSLAFSDAVRALPELRRLWALWHNCDAQELVPSRDRVGIMTPNNPKHAPWPHVDADIFNPRAVRVERSLQGFVVWKTGHYGQGFWVHPGSHLQFDEWAEDQQAPAKAKNFYPLMYPALDKCQQAERINPPAGSVVVWLSETVHWNSSGAQGRPTLGRVVSYIAYCPQQQLSEADKRFMEEAVLTQETTGHRVKDANLLKAGGSRFQPNVWQFDEQDLAIYASLEDVPRAILPWCGRK